MSNPRLGWVCKSSPAKVVQNLPIYEVYIYCIITFTFQLNPFRSAVPFWGQITHNLTGLSPKRDCSPEGVNSYPGRRSYRQRSSGQTVVVGCRLSLLSPPGTQPSFLSRILLYVVGFSIPNYRRILLLTSALALSAIQCSHSKKKFSRVRVCSL